MKKTALYQLAIILIVIVGTTSCERTIVYDRPIENWVFRSVIDKQPRMLTVALHKDLYACYNLQSGNLYKIWKGGVNYDGAVYTTAHGIQPTSFGFPYMQDDSLQTQWGLKTSETIEIPEINYLGYSLINGQVGLDFELKSKTGESIKIREIPEVGLKDSTIAMVRTFHILEGSSNSMTPVLRYDLNTGVVKNELIAGGNRNGVSNVLEIVGNTTIETYFTQIPKNWKPPVIDYLGLISDGMQLAEQSDCKACHLVNENLVGPAYDSIAKRYPFDWMSVDMLADKIKLGGTGVWGNLLMTAHPGLSKADTQKMSYYILSLDGEIEPSNRSVDIALDTPDVPIEIHIKILTDFCQSS